MALILIGPRARYHTHTSSPPAIYEHYPRGRGDSSQRADQSRFISKRHDAKEILFVFQSVDDVDSHVLHDADLRAEIALVSL